MAYKKGSEILIISHFCSTCFAAPGSLGRALKQTRLNVYNNLSYASILTFWTSLCLSILAVWFFGRKKPAMVWQNSQACYLGIGLYIFLDRIRVDSCWSGWFKYHGRISSIASKSINAWPDTLTALPVLMAHGPEKK